MKKFCFGLIGLALLFSTPLAWAEKAAPLSALAKLPVKEVTVFKDGHAFVLHAGTMPANDAGNVELDYLPEPLLGTFWPFCADKRAKLSGVTASQRKVLVERTALTVRELIEANVGAEVMVTEAPVGDSDKKLAPLTYRATILSVPTQSGEELEALSPPNSGPRLPQKGNIILLKLQEGGVKAIDFTQILNVTFMGAHKDKAASEELRNLLTLKLDWADGKPQKQAEVGLLYVQRGVRWIPSYRVTIDGKGNAAVKLEATLINELADLEDVTAHLVIGVGSFAFKDTLDPMGLQQQMAQLTQYFRQDLRNDNFLGNGGLFSNTGQIIMGQQAIPAGVGGAAGGARAVDLGPDVANTGKNEDLYIFSVKHITLKKGQRMVVPISEFTLKYKDVYTLDVPFAPPPEVWRNFQGQQQADLARMFAAPRVIHKIRLVNSTDAPLTTAPAMIMRDDRILSQGMMTYAAPGAESDLELTTAVDVRVAKSEKETKRTPNAAQWQGSQFGRIDLDGKLTLTNFGKQAVEVEIVRNVLGNVTEADNNGKIEMVNVFEDSSFATGGAPYGWGGYGWPWWWHHFNGVGRVRWTVKLEPGKPVELGYVWHYYWQ